MIRPAAAPYPPPGPPVTFAYPPNSRMHECSVCGARGGANGSWKIPHRRGHTRCPDCHRWGLTKLDGTPRVHTRCPRRAQEQVAPGTVTRAG